MHDIMDTQHFADLDQSKMTSVHTVRLERINDTLHASYSIYFAHSKSNLVGRKNDMQRAIDMYAGNTSIERIAEVLEHPQRLHDAFTIIEGVHFDDGSFVTTTEGDFLKALI